MTHGKILQDAFGKYMGAIVAPGNNDIPGEDELLIASKWFKTENGAKRWIEKKGYKVTK